MDSRIDELYQRPTYWRCHAPPCGGVSADGTRGYWIEVLWEQRGEHLEAIHNVCGTCERPLIAGVCQWCAAVYDGGEG
jgi:hypothetical protein